MKVFSVAEMVAAEKAADAAGVTYAQMMETAGKAVAEAIMSRRPLAEAKVLVLVGPGNNGGDGLVCGRYLAEAGADVAFYLYKPRDPESDVNYAKILEMGLFTIEAGFDQRYRVLRTRLDITDILVDALLGTGVSRPIGGNLGKLMRLIRDKVTRWRQNDKVTRWQGDKARTEPAEVVTDVSHLVSISSPHPLTPSSPHPLIVAVDCPSGLNCDTGALDPLAFPADLTVTFAGPKRGHFIFPGAAACGELVAADIGIPPDLPEVKGVKVEVVTAVTAQSLLPPRPPNGHKGAFGKILIASGCDLYRGAPVLAAKAAFRAGSGLVALAVPEVIRQSSTVLLPEATYAPVVDKTLLSAETARQLLAQMGQYKALLTGPGLGDAADFLTTLLAGKKTLPPLVVDADGLNILSRLPDWPSLLPPDTILTPHPGEMSRLMGISLRELKARDRVAAAQEQAQTWGHIVLLKGAYTVVARPSGTATIIPFANPALAVGGSGDVLSGIIVSLLGQGMAAYEAAILGAYLHGAAAALYPGSSGLLAGEMADLVPQAMEQLRAT
ncbi:MAG TPA: NAD(P)H-hydrate dehydratase [Anaerolineae bacterium]|nr:NAD(P)H-hydrate dehydratase [Anaerolineae bacterium]